MAFYRNKAYQTLVVVLTYILPKYVYDFTKHNQITYQALFKF